MLVLIVLIVRNQVKSNDKVIFHEEPVTLGSQDFDYVDQTNDQSSTLTGKFYLFQNIFHVSFITNLLYL